MKKFKVARAPVKNVALSFVPPDGRLFKVPAFELVLNYREDGTVIALQVEFPIDATLHAAIDAGAWFHLEPEARGPGRVDVERPALIILQLRSDLTAKVIDNVGLEPFSAAAHISLKGTIEAFGDPLLQTESWYAVSVSQETMPGLREGYRTRWASDAP